MIRFIWLIPCLALLSACTDKATEQTVNTPAVPVEKTAPRNGSAFANISPDQAQKSGIEILTAQSGDIRETVKLFGSIRPNAERQQEVRARYPGIVREITKRPGDHVAKDALLLKIESNDSLEPYAIRSPIAGTVLDRRINAGEAIDSSKVLMVVADLSSVWADFSVFARDFPRLRAGQPVLLEDATGNVQTKATLAYIAPAGDQDSQTVLARAVIDNRSGHWVPGQFVTGYVTLSSARVPVAISAAALQTFHHQTVVFVEKGDGFEPRAVALGRQAADIVEIIDGLSPGERYAAKNSYLIKSELLKDTGEEN